MATEDQPHLSIVVAMDRQRVIGLDGLIVITNQANPIQSISLEELAQIYVHRGVEIGG